MTYGIHTVVQCSQPAVGQDETTTPLVVRKYTYAAMYVCMDW